MELNMKFNNGHKDVSMYNNSDNSLFMLVVDGVKTLFTNESEMMSRFRQECGINI
jgi:hypothetical protein